ncbi:RluA family pseudouridine synthase [Salisediminibacterium beveridgei]|nr:RluA family pseudouridine synthase [Salisediminibacterium beveridgei]
MSIRDYVRDHLLISRKLLAEIKFQGGSIRLNGEPRNVDVSLHSKDYLDILFPPEKIGSGIVTDKTALDIVFEDDWCIVVNKPAGLLSIPNEDPSESSIAGRVLYYFLQKEYPATIHPVTRLDRQTSGLMMFAKDRYSHSLFMKQHMHKEIQKYYTAAVSCAFPWRWGTVIAPIARHPESIVERMVSDEGKFAITRFERIRQNGERSILQLRIETGRTHQIRVHLAWLGFAIYGDDLYGNEETARKAERTLLHASGLAWLDPKTGHPFNCYSHVPEHFQ